MVNLLAGFTATIVTIPLIGFVMIYFISKVWLKDNRKSLFISVDITTVLFIIAVHFLLLIIFGKSFFWLIFTVLVLSVLSFGYLNWRMSHKIDTFRILKGFWRFTFLLFFLAYFILFISGLLQRIFSVTLN
ncbi:DUF3397 domain-containing protein [Fredinandcohnia quinoae]|uniref:DUF3397 domain-containing protein n=1 Tax=Fredinandcohnia quinoae TaxID=2918902 RepID=A0AAW5E1K1_9BACI|nr:DUF3397 domain-containing protein [Fredinandcohnia sp. SECRCQ15]MCH1623886.1 DUF3397 domain-containing protein [Fredinandcohnia sp. SECRCQ15]